MQQQANMVLVSVGKKSPFRKNHTKPKNVSTKCLRL